MVLCKAEGNITIALAGRSAGAGKPPRSTPASRLQSAAASGQWGNVSKNSSKRLPDSFTSAEFHMYSCATVITIKNDDTSRPFCYAVFALFELIDSGRRLI
jgi:hypothetical protein